MKTALLVRSACASLAFLCLSLQAQEAGAPALATYVLAPGRASFQAEDGWTIICQESKTLTIMGDGTGSAKGSRLATRECYPWTVGRYLQVWGKRNKRTHTIVAVQLKVDEPLPKQLAGFALIDKVLEPEKAGVVALRADGYVLRATPQTKLPAAEGSIRSLSAFTANMWVRYKGTPQADGSLVLTEMLVTPNAIAKRESGLRDKNTFDAEGVRETDRQSKVNKFFLGLNAKRIPIHEDPQMQTRVERVGETLIPAFQKALPFGDPTRITFSFHLVDLDEGRDALALPSGIILVPYKVVQQLNDPQLAAVLATNIGTVLQKQTLRYLPTAHALSAISLAGVAGGLVVPGLSIATGVGTGLKAQAAAKLIEEQDLREGMALLHDAGYDLTEAPTAWWLIHSNPKKTAPNGPMPANAAYCYQLLGTVWRTSVQAATRQ